MLKQTSGKSSGFAGLKDPEPSLQHSGPEEPVGDLQKYSHTDELDSLRKEQIEFLREITHKLSQPATSLRFCLEFAAQGNEAKLREAVAQAAGLTENLIDLLNAVRDLSEALDPGDSQETVDLEEFARNALSQAGTSNVKFVWETSHGSARPSVRFHPGRLQRALINLFIEAATDCASEKQIALRITEEPGQINLCCSYTSGLLARSHERFFLPFAARGSKLDPRALSVAISQRIAEAAGGTLQLRLHGAQRELRFTVPSCPKPAGASR